MALPSGTYTHREHVDALRASLSLDPLQPLERKALVDLSLGRDGDKNAITGARNRLSAPSRPSAFYVALAVHLFDDPFRLTDDEVLAIRRLASGGDSREIGEALGYATENSQRNKGVALLQSAMEKLKVRNRVELIRAAYRVRLIEPKEGRPPLPPWTP